MSSRLKRLGLAATVATCTAVVAIGPGTANAGLVDDLVGGVKSTVNDTLNSVNGALGGGSAAPAPAPTPVAGVPPTYTPPLHGTNPHGQGTVGVVDLTPLGTEPLPYDIDAAGAEEDIVVGRARGEQNGDAYHGHITIVSTFLTGEVVGVDTDEGETEAGPLDPIQEGILDALCDGSGDQICLEVLAADSSTSEDGSFNRFAVADVAVGGPTGITATAAESNGNISDDGECQTAHGDSTVANASVGGALTADVLESESDSTACNDGTETVTQDSRVVNLNENGLPVPAAGCADGTPDSNFDPLLPLLGAVCNADDVNNGQTSDPYGVREALSLFVLDISGVPLVKTTTAAAESHAVAPGEECPDPTNPDCPPPPCPDPTNPDCPPEPECPDPTNPDCPPDDECPDPTNPDCPPDDECPDPTNPDCPDGPGGPSGDGPEDDLPFTGADMAMLGLIGLGVMGGGLALMALSDQRRRVAVE